jgi:hypothetical protein
MYRLEHNVGDKRKAEDEAPRIAKILVRRSNWCTVYVNEYATMVLSINLAFEFNVMIISLKF